MTELKIKELAIYRDGELVGSSDFASSSGTDRLSRAEGIKRRFQQMTASERPFAETLRLARELGEDRAAQRLKIKDLRAKIGSY